METSRNSLLNNHRKKKMEKKNYQTPTVEETKMYVEQPLAAGSVIQPGEDDEPAGSRQGSGWDDEE